MNEQVQNLYDEAASDWVRRQPESLSDFTARPVVFSRLESIIQGASVADLGCGEGYCARQLSKMGAGSVQGIDISPEMIERATRAEAEDQLGNLKYSVGSVTSLSLPSSSIDIAIGVFVYNYLSISEMNTSIQEVFRILKPGGTFTFTVPHPALPFIRAHAAPFYFDAEDHNYFNGRDRSFSGKIWKRDGVSLPVVAVHKLFEDYTAGLTAAGFTHSPYVKELGVTDDLIQQSPDFFGQLEGTPLHVLFESKKP